MTAYAVAATPEPSTTDPWEARGAAVAGVLEGIGAAVVLGENPERAARVALGIARAASAHRRVALGDLVGDLGPLYESAGGADAFGLSDCFREGLPLNDVARLTPDCEALFILPAGTPPVATAEVLAHERWPRLIRGFAEAGALLLLVAPLDSTGLDALVAAVGGVVLVDTPPERVARYPVLVIVRERPPEAGAEPPPKRRRARDQRAPGRRIVAAAFVAALLTLAIWTWMSWRVRSARPAAVPFPAAAPAAAQRLGPGDRSSASPTVTPGARADTVRIGAVVNPEDSAVAAQFAVELVAANTAASAISVLRDATDAASAGDRGTALVVPVQLGGSALWFRAILGAWPTRARADSLLDALRSRGLVRRGAGTVVRVPYALLLAQGLSTAAADDAVKGWRARGVGAYALLQSDGSARVFAGAFETAAQVAPLAVQVRDAGVPPVMAFRTGRAY